MSFLEILGLFKQGKGTVKSHLKNLIEMALADGQFIEVENELLLSIAKKNGFSESRLLELRNNTEAVKFELPEDARLRFEQFYDLINMMSIDSLIHTEEMKLCNLFAIKFGYPRAHVQTLIDSILSCIEYKRSADETMDRVMRLIV